MRSDVLDLSTNGATKYDRDRQKYSQLIDNVETRLTIRLRDQLGSAENALTMFKIFRMYNVLFVRPRIRGAIREYQVGRLHRATRLVSHASCHSRCF